MKELNLRAYIGKRIRILRTQKHLTQQQLEEDADLPLKYTYKLENLEPNITVETLEKIMTALDTDIESFFDISLKEDIIIERQSTNTLENLRFSKAILDE
ncbi:helix-turn-helix domain-containing protein, partial [Streptococcus anginosus]|uniref:helix-turn-helix domain-containing protein n=1 Tax=Streptococcus anginosus TaxID=1328 RepID=UPI0023302EA9